MRLKLIREAKGLSQLDLEDLSGVPQPNIAMLERVVQPNPKWDTVCRLSYALGERPETIFGIPLQFKESRRRSYRLVRTLKRKSAQAAATARAERKRRR